MLNVIMLSVVAPSFSLSQCQRRDLNLSCYEYITTVLPVALPTPCLFSNLRLGWICMSASNTLAFRTFIDRICYYLVNVSLEKSFYFYIKNYLSMELGLAFTKLLMNLL
jgi:hypothetical protein